MGKKGGDKGDRLKEIACIARYHISRSTQFASTTHVKFEDQSLLLNARTNEIKLSKLKELKRVYRW